MDLKIKILKWSAGLPVAMLNKKTAEKMGVYAQDRIFIKTISKHPKKMSTIIDIVEGLVRQNEIAVSSELKKNMGVKVGQKVSEGEQMLILEAMKMKNTILFHIDGTVKSIHVKEGEKISKDHLMVEMK